MGVKPKRYRAEFIEPGIVSYEDVDAGNVYLSKEAIDKMLSTFVGCPVFNFAHKETQAENAFDFAKWETLTDEEKEDLADGIISAVGYNTETGWFWADMLIWDEETQVNLDEKGYSVSCAYVPTETAEGGVYHNIEYAECVEDGVFTHMAIVDNPRYEGARVFANSKGGKSKVKIKWFPSFGNKPKAKKNAGPPVPPKKPVEKKPDDKPEDDSEQMVNAEESLVMVGEEKVPLADLIAAYKAGQGSGEEETPEDGAESFMNGDDEVEVDGKKVKVSELMASYQKANEVVEILDEDAEDVVDETKQRTNKKEKTNGKDEKPNENFTRVKTARNNSSETEFKPSHQSRTARLAAGSERYSLKPTTEAK
jgi:hypothetical protein